MIVFVWKLLENTDCIYFIYRVYAASPKNKRVKAVFDSDDMIFSAQHGLPCQSSLPVFSFSAQALPLPWSFFELFHPQFILISRTRGNSQLSTPPDNALHCSLMLLHCKAPNTNANFLKARPCVLIFHLPPHSPFPKPRSSLRMGTFIKLHWELLFMWTNGSF